MIRLMTSNIWGDYFGNEVAVREDQLFEVYQKYACDVIGIREVTPSWHSSALMTNMKAALDATDHSPVFVDLEL